MSKHTPGPWTIKYGTNVGAPRSGCDWALVAAAGGFSTNTDDGEHIEESAANARLIAAAPKLLEALGDMTSGWCYIRKVHGDLTGVGWDRAEDAARAAIAKARGEA